MFFISFTGCYINKRLEKPKEPPSWIMMYNTGEYTEIRDLLETEEGDFVTVGGTQPSKNKQSSFLLMKVDPHGNAQWAKAFSDGKNDSAWSIIQTTDNNYLISGDATVDLGRGAFMTDFLMLKIDEKGSIQWTKKVEDTWITSISQTKDGGFIASGCYSKDKWFPVIKFDSNGNVRWAKNYQEGEGIANFITQTSDEGFIVASAERVGPNMDSVMVMKLDSDGNEQWAKIFKEEGTESNYINYMSETTDKGFIVTGSFGIMKLDIKGNIKWVKAFVNSRLKSIYQTKDGGFVALCSTFPWFNPFVVKINSKGMLKKIVFAKELHSPFESSDIFLQTSDGGFIISGGTDSYNPLVGRTSFLLKLNSNGEISGGCNYIKSYDTKYLTLKTPELTTETIVPLVSSSDLESVSDKMETSTVSVQSTLICDKSLKKTIVLHVNSPEMTVNSVSEEIGPRKEIRPIIKDEIVLVPISAVIRVLGAKMSFDEKEGNVTIIFEGKTVEFWIGKRGYRINGVNIDVYDPHYQNAVPEVINGEVMFPLWFFEDILGCKSDFESSTQMITITYPAG